MNNSMPIETILNRIGKDEETTERFLDSFVNTLKAQLIVKDSITISHETSFGTDNIHTVGLNVEVFIKDNEEPFWSQVIKNM